MAEVNTNDFLESYKKFLQEEDLPTQPPTTEVKPPVEKPIPADTLESANPITKDFLSGYKKEITDTPSKSVWKTIGDYADASISTAWSQSSQAIGALLMEDEFSKLDAAKGTYSFGDYAYDVFKYSILPGALGRIKQTELQKRFFSQTKHADAYKNNPEYREKVNNLETELFAKKDKIIGAKQKKLQDKFDRLGYNDLNEDVVQGLASTASFIPFAVATYATRNPAVLETYIGLMGLQSKGLAFSDAIDRGADYSTALSNSNINGVIESALGRVGFGPNSKFMRNFISRNDGATKQMLKQAPINVLTELGAENATTLLQETSGLLHGIQTELKVALDNQDNPEYTGASVGELVFDYFQATSIATLVGTGGTLTATGTIKYTGDTLGKMAQAGIKKGGEFLDAHNTVVKNVERSNRVLHKLTMDPLEEKTFQEFINNDSYIDHIAREIITLDLDHYGPQVKKPDFPRMDRPVRPQSLLQGRLDSDFDLATELSFALGKDGKLPINVLGKKGDPTNFRDMDDVVVTLQENGFLPPFNLDPNRPEPSYRDEAFEIIARNEPNSEYLTERADFEMAFDMSMEKFLNQQKEPININQIRSKNRLKRDDVEDSLSRLEEKGIVFEDNNGDFRISRPTDEQVPLTMETIPMTLQDSIDRQRTEPEFFEEEAEFQAGIEEGRFVQVMNVPKRKKNYKVADDPDPKNTFEYNDLEGFFDFWERQVDIRFANKWSHWNKIQKGVTKELGIEGVEDQYRSLGFNPDERAFEVQIQADIFQGPVAETSKFISKDMLPKLVKHLDDNNISTDQFDLFLYAQHARERNNFIKEKNQEELTILERKEDKTPKEKKREEELKVKIENASGSGMTTQKAQDILSDIDIDVMEDGKMIAKSNVGQAYLDGYERFVDPLLETKRESYREAGLVNENQIDDWSERYRYYVPLKGFAEDTLEQFGLEAKASPNKLINSAFTTPKTLEKEAKGRDSLAMSPLTQTINDVIASKIYQQKNRVAQAAGEFAMAFPQSELYEVSKANMFDAAYGWGENGKNPDSAKILFKQKGQSYALTIKSEKLAVPFSNMDNTAKEFLFRTARPITRYLSYINTSLDPEFIMNNFLRDVQTGYFNLLSERDMKDGRLEDISLMAKEDVAKKFNAKNLFKNTKRFIQYERARNAKNNIERDKYDYRIVEAFKKAGGQTGFLDQKTLEERAKEIQNLMDIYEGDLKANAKKTFVTAANVIEDTNFAVENAARLTAFEIYIEAKGGLDKVTGSDLDRAASLAKNLTVNFNRGGTATGAMNAFYLFFNASIQGTANVFRGATTERKQKIFAGLASVGMASTVYNVLASGEDEDGELFWNKISDFDKATGYIFMFPGVENIDGEIKFRKYGVSGRGKKYFVIDEKGKERPIGIKIPMPYGYAFFHNIGRITTEVAMSNLLDNYTKDIPKAGLELSQSLIANYSPIGFDNTENVYLNLAKTFTPDALGPIPTKPVLELAINRDFFGAPIYFENFPGQNKPSSWHENNKTSDWIEWATKRMNEASGGTEFASGGIDVDPSIIQYFIDYLTGGLGRLAGRTERLLLSDEDVTLSQKPFIRRLAVTTRDVTDTSDFFNNYIQLTDIQSQYRDSFDSVDDGDAWLDKNYPWARDLINTKSTRLTRKTGNRSLLNDVKKQLDVFRDEADLIRNNFYESDREEYYKRLDKLRLEQNAYYQSVNKIIDEEKESQD